MRHDDERALVRLQRHDQRPSHLEIEVIGRLVEQEEIWPLLHQRGEREAGFFAAGKRPDRPAGALAGKAEATEKIAQQLLALAAVQTREHRERRFIGPQQLDLVLREVANDAVARGTALARERREFTRQQAHQRGFAGAVHADHGQPVGARHAERDARDHAAPAIAGGSVLELDHALRLPQRCLELDAERFRGVHRRHARHLLQALQAALHLACLARLGAKARHEGGNALHLALLLCRGARALLELERALPFVE